MVTVAEIGQRHGQFWYKVIDVDAFEARYQIASVRSDGLGWEMTREQIFRGETAHMDAERAMTDDLMAAIYRGVDPA